MKIIGLIYDTYPNGTPLAGIVEMLHQENISSPFGKEHWSTVVLHEILSGSRYIPLIGFEKYVAAQFELDKRANTIWIQENERPHGIIHKVC